MKIVLRGKHAQMFCEPLIEFIQKNPNLFKNTGGERDEVRTAGTTAGLGVGEITIEQSPKLQAKSKARSINGSFAS
ncbi:hypothetical protein [Bacillus wiedmannii]|uniref:Uncharacterized protein n=1 Tax=Bacillus wiedmannii TaxID=1890302 RepID=A0A2A8BTA2_9BACI|nr:hypothetical protein [Bacillus wiedmannii]PEM57606.1 hypothetical protein CN611_07275 [Bacillus wiedmannii]